MNAADKLIDRIVNSSRLPSHHRRSEIQRELRAHIEDFVLAAREAGRGEDEIQQMMLAHFGDPGQVAQGFAWVYRHERRRLRTLVFTISTVLLAGSLLAAILTMQAGVAFSLGTPIVRVLASRHTAIEALDILAAVAVYLGVTSLENLFGSHPFQKAALLLTLLLTVLIASCAAAGLHAPYLIYGLVTGIFFRAVQRFVTPKVVQIGIVLVCFSLAGLVSALQWSHGSTVALATTCTSWLAIGAGYHVMTRLAARVDAALLNGLQRIQAGN